jgi:hypothetical protein
VRNLYIGPVGPETSRSQGPVQPEVPLVRVGGPATARSRAELSTAPAGSTAPRHQARSPREPMESSLRGGQATIRSGPDPERGNDRGRERSEPRRRRTRWYESLRNRLGRTRRACAGLAAEGGPAPMRSRTRTTAPFRNNGCTIPEPGERGTHPENSASTCFFRGSPALPGLGEWPLKLAVELQPP